MKLSNYNIFYADNQLLFNTFSQCLLKITTNIYNILINENFDLLDQEIYDLFVQKKIITESYAYERNLLNHELNNAIKSHEASNIIISLTSSCNLDCWYCIEKARKDIKNKKKIELEQWQEIKEVIVNEVINEESQYIDVVLYGGEPMLNKPLILRIVNDLRGLETEKLKFNFTLITNGTLLEAEDAILKKIDSIQITIDATESNHNKNRPYKNGRGSFNDIYNSLLKYAFLYPDKFILRINLIANDYDKVIDFMLKLKNDKINSVLKFIAFCPIMDNKCKQCREISIEAEEYIFKLNEFAKINDFKISSLHEYGLCAAYNDSTLCVDENLNLYSCIGFMYDNTIGYIKNGKIIKEKNDIGTSCAIDDKCKFLPLCLGGSPCSKSCCKEYYEIFYPKYLMLQYGISLRDEKGARND